MLGLAECDNRRDAVEVELLPGVGRVHAGLDHRA
jgi:hypothetical protein